MARGGAGMKTIFFGTPDYVLPILNSLHKEFKGRSYKSPIVAIVTQKPMPAGRKQKLTYSAVDSWAHKKKLPVFYNPNELVKKNIKADLGVLAAYGEIIPKFVIDHLSFDILNVHPSLLPSLRGASPVQAAIVMAERKTGVTIIKIDELLDHGPIVSQFSEEILPKDTTDSLRRRLFERSAEVIKTLLPAYLKGKIVTREQDHKSATFTRLIKKDDAFIPPKYLGACLQGRTLQADWEIPFIKNYSLLPSPYTLERFIRAMQPWPQAWTYVQLTEKRKNPVKSSQSSDNGAGEKTEKRLKILKAHLEPTTINHQSLIIDEIQLEGKNPVSWKQFRQAYNVQF